VYGLIIQVLVLQSLRIDGSRIWDAATIYKLKPLPFIHHHESLYRLQVGWW